MVPLNTTAPIRKRAVKGALAKPINTGLSDAQSAYTLTDRLWYHPGADEQHKEPRMKRRQRVAIYVRVSRDDQRTINQERELRDWCERAGHEVVQVYKDHGISGATA